MPRTGSIALSRHNERVLAEIENRHPDFDRSFTLEACALLARYEFADQMRRKGRSPALSVLFNRHVAQRLPHLVRELDGAARGAGDLSGLLATPLKRARPRFALVEPA